MYYKCNSKCNGMLALIRFSDTFYLVVPKHFFIPLISPPRYKPPPPVYKHTENPILKLYKPRALKWDFTVLSLRTSLAVEIRNSMDNHVMQEFWTANEKNTVVHCSRRLPVYGVARVCPNIIQSSLPPLPPQRILPPPNFEEVLKNGL